MPDWKDEIPEDYRNSTLIAEAKSIGDLAKFAVETQQMLGSSLRIPSEHASDDDKAVFSTKLTELGMMPREGFREALRPTEAKDYKYENGVDEKLGVTQTDMDRWKTEAHLLGLAQDQFNDYVAHNVDDRKAALTAREESFSAADAALKDEWGEHAFEAKKQQALNALKRFGDDSLVARMDANPDPTLLRTFAEIGKQFEEAGMGDLDMPVVLPETRDEATAKLAEINNNPDHPFNKGPMGSGGTQAYDAAATEVMRLRRVSMGYPARATDDMFEEAR